MVPASFCAMALFARSPRAMDSAGIHGCTPDYRIVRQHTTIIRHPHTILCHPPKTLLTDCTKKSTCHKNMYESTWISKKDIHIKTDKKAHKIKLSTKLSTLSTFLDV